jgi:hypothetical protein
MLCGIYARTISAKAFTRYRNVANMQAFGGNST